MDLTNLTSGSQTLQGVALWTNNNVNGVLFTGGLIVFFIIIVMALQRYAEPFENILAVSGWSMFIVSLFFWFAHLVPTLLVLFFLLMAVVGTFQMYAS